MTKVRTKLNPLRAGQLTDIAISKGFADIATYLDAHIREEWLKLHPPALPALPSFEMYNGTHEDGDSTVFFELNGIPPITIYAKQALQFGHGIEAVLANEQRNYFMASLIDEAILSFTKQGTGYVLLLMVGDSSVKTVMHRSIAQDIAHIFNHYGSQ